MIHVDLAVIGGGPAGLAAAIGAREEGIENILILERDDKLGGILNQCIHNGFGLHTFKEELTGPEYAARYVQKVQEMNIPMKLNTMVIDMNSNKEMTAVNEDGIHQIKAGAVVLAMGCRERARGALNIGGYRPAGIYTAGTAQKFVNLDGYMPGKEVVVLGSGDIGLIMARRMTLEGARVKTVVELMPYSGGLKRNIVQCLDDFDIPLKLSHTIVGIHGHDRLTGVTIANVDENRRPVSGSEEYIKCDTLLLSVGLLPENELSALADVHLSPITGGPEVNESMQTNIEGIFACGNVLHVHDLVDFVSEESRMAGRKAANFIKGKQYGTRGAVKLKAGRGVRYTVPDTVHSESIEDKIDIRFRVGDVYKNQYICLYFGENLHLKKKKMILTPGEMESISLSKEIFEKYPNTKTITVTVEED